MNAESPSQARTQFQRLSVLIGVNLVDMIGLMLVLPLLPFYAIDLGASDVTIGWLIAAFPIAQLISAPIWGRVSDRYGRRPALVIGLTASAIAYLVFGLASSVWLLFLSRFVQGAGGGTTGVAQAYVADTVRPADRAMALGWLSAATNIGVTFGPVLGAFATHWGRSAPGILAAVLCAVNAWFAWRLLPESRRPAADEVKVVRKPVWDAAWQVLRHPTGPVPRYVWIYGIGMFAFTCFTSIIALFLKAEYQVTAKTIGFFFTYIGILNLLMRLVLLGPIVRRIGETWSMRVGAGFLVIGLLLYPNTHTILQLAIVMPLVPVGTALLFPATTSLMSRASDKREIGTTMGVAQTYGGVSRVMAPLLGTQVFQRVGHAWPFYMGAGMVALVSALAFQVDHPAPTVDTPLPQ
ncbi:MAG: MFS transporter [Gemmatimonadota bacterium]